MVVPVVLHTGHPLRGSHPPSGMNARDESDHDQWSWAIMSIVADGLCASIPITTGPAEVDRITRDRWPSRHVVFVPRADSGRGRDVTPTLITVAAMTADEGCRRPAPRPSPAWA